jgi:ketol-acid reductoisomerase
MATMYYDNDADLSLIQGKKVAIIGYGSQGHAHALNLKDSGVSVRVGLPATSRSRAKAQAAGLVVGEVGEVAAWADVVMILIPDHVQGKIYREEIEPNLQPGNMLMFAHGFNIRFGAISPRADLDVAMVAPKSPGHRVRELFVEGGGTPALFAIQQDATGHARALTLSYAKGIGVMRAGVIETTFKEETEIAYFECCHELKLIVDLIYQGGLNYMRYSVSDTAEHGDYTGGPKIVTEETRRAMKQMLDDIQSGRYAKGWIAENEAGRPSFNKLREVDRHHQIEQVGARLRQMMPFLKPVSADDTVGAAR